VGTSAPGGKIVYIGRCIRLQYARKQVTHSVEGRIKQFLNMHPCKLLCCGRSEGYETFERPQREYVDFPQWLS
jgi:hypothetical protein